MDSKRKKYNKTYYTKNKQLLRDLALIKKHFKIANILNSGKRKSDCSLQKEFKKITLTFD